MNTSLQTVPAPESALDAVTHCLRQLNSIVLGKEHEIKLALVCLLAKGHLLIEDQPGMGKTTLAHALAHCLGLTYSRVQFTSDLLPADIVGVSLFEQHSSQFHFHKGPIFAQLVLADEINRATPKAQSALLEAMEEQQVTVDGNTYPLSSPFFVIATQNPSDQVGTFALPESQLDRFLMRITLGYPDPAHERQLLAGADRRDLLSRIESTLQPNQLLTLQQRIPQVHTSAALLDYIQAILAYTRQGQFITGLSPRAGIGLLRAAQAWSLLHGHIGVLPEDVQAVLTAVIGHRLQLADTTSNAQEIGRQVREAVAVP